jgi:hypothetical protein
MPEIALIVPDGKPPSAPFDYAALPSVDLADELRATADRIRGKLRASVLDIGRELAEAKKRIDHGHFVMWCENECGVPIRTAQRLMRATETAAKSDNLSCLPVDALLALSHATPEVISGVTACAAAGQRPTTAAIRAEVAKIERLAAERQRMKLSTTPKVVTLGLRIKAADAAYRQAEADGVAPALAVAEAIAETERNLIVINVGDLGQAAATIVDRLGPSRSRQLGEVLLSAASVVDAASVRGGGR